jgi:hypothetical protein
VRGLSSDPGFPYPVTRNLGGSIVSGAEVAVEAQPAAWLDLGLAYAYVDARFRGGVIDLLGGRLDSGTFGRASTRPIVSSSPPTT